MMKVAVEPRVRGGHGASSILCALLLSASPALASQQPSAAPDWIFTGQFITLDPQHPQAEAIAVSAGRIVAVGSTSDVLALAAKATQRIQIPGIALPGFADAHTHPELLGEQLDRLNLRGLTKAQILAKVADAARSAPPGKWIYGGGWDQGFWQPATFPTAKELDAVSGNHPVSLDRIDYHSIWVNSKVLALAKISGATPDPDGGRIWRDAAGQPTGLLVDNATALVAGVTPKPTQADRSRHIRLALRQYTQWGLTSVHDAGVDLEIIGIYKDLLKRGKLPVRLYVMARGDAAVAHYLASGPELDLGNGMLTVRSIKLILDGALGSRGAEMTSPYSDAPGVRGLQTMNDADLAKVVAEARQHGLQVNAHAIGDRAVARALNAFESGGVTRDERFRIEHASVVTNDDLARFGRLGIIALDAAGLRR